MWVKLDDEFYDHPKWAGAPGDSIALWVAMIAWCNRNDSTEGFIPALKTRGLVNVRNVKATLADLCVRGEPPVIRAEGHGYVIHDYAEYQQPEKVRDIAAKRSAAGTRGANKRWNKPIANDMANAIANAPPNVIANGCPGPVSPSPSTESALTGHHRPHGSAEDDKRFATVLESLTDRRIERYPAKTNGLNYRTKVLQSIAAEHGETIRSFLAARPDHPAQLCADALALEVIT